MNILEEMKKLKYDYECQCKENGKKQDIIYELKRKIREQDEKIQDLKDEIKLLKEVLNARNSRK
jgi:hypothetical protein